MRRKLFLSSVVMMSLMIVAGAALAQEHETATTAAAGSNNMWLWIVSGFGMTLVSSMAAFAMAISVKSFCEGVSRNPGAAKVLQAGLILTLVLIETLALYVLAVIFVKVV